VFCFLEEEEEDGVDGTEEEIVPWLEAGTATFDKVGGGVGTELFAVVLFVFRGR
jgi:hypothetical protein